MSFPPFVIDALAELRKRTTFLPVPPPEFDPLGPETTSEQLCYYGLPVPGDFPPGSPEHIARVRFLTGPTPGTKVRFVAADADPALYPPALAKVRLAVPGHPWPQGGSNNWSGGYVTPRGGDRITFMEGNWTVPADNVPMGGVAPEYYSSTWIGFDGQRSYRDSTLPQIGTLQGFITASGATTPVAWYQWWAKHTTPVVYPLPNLTVSAGDAIYASLTVLSDTKVRCNMKNVTSGVILTAFNIDAPAGCLVSGATAEWIMERPSPLSNPDPWIPYPLPRYQDFSFTGCSAKTTAPNGSASSTMDLELARLIRMKEITEAPPGARTISVARKTPSSSQQLDMRYTGP